MVCNQKENRFSLNRNGIMLSFLGRQFYHSTLYIYIYIYISLLLFWFGIISQWLSWVEGWKQRGQYFTLYANIKLGLLNILIVSLQMGKTPQTIVLDMTLNYLMVRLQSWSFGGCRIHFHCHCSQVHSDSEW